MNIHDVIEGKRAWRAHQARIKALPDDFQIAYKEIQKYLFKVGPADLEDGIDVLTGIVDLFEQAAMAGKTVLQVTGRDVAGFCDDLIATSPTRADQDDATVSRATSEAMNKIANKEK
jgi:DNA-binding ferritin-like protein (Dps family)